MKSFEDFLLWYKDENVDSTVEAMQILSAFYYKKVIDMLKLGCTLLKMANIYLHKSANVKF